MLAPEDRELLVDAVRPDSGYTLDHALITTYSLDLDALLAIPVALTFHSWSGDNDGAEGQNAERIDPVVLLESLRQHADQLTVLSQAGAIVTPRNCSFLSFLEPVVRGVTAPQGGVFHPKFWLLRYLPRESDEPIRYRLLCLSRNLTFDRSWDTMLRLDASLAEHRSRGYRSNRSLQEFVRGLIEVATSAPGGLDNRRRRTLSTIAEESARLQFELPEGAEGHRFWPLGFDRTSVGDVFEGRRDRTLVVAPFVSGGFLKQLGLGRDDMLVSRTDELVLLPDETREQIGRIGVMGEATTVELEAADGVEGSQAATTEDGLSGLHAKLFVADAGWDARMWTGSANATEAAFGSNVEFVVELNGKKSSFGIGALLGSDDGDGLAKLLIPYEHDPGAALDPKTQRLEHAIDRLAQALGASSLRLCALEKDNGWTLSLSAEGELPPFPEGLDVVTWPATLQDHRAKPLAPKGDFPSWEGLDLVQLTGFLCLRISAGSGEIRREVAIAIPLEGAPVDRDAAVVRSVLANRDRVLRYLLFLLGDHDSDAADAFDALGSGGDEDGGIGAWLGFGADGTLFEALVRSLHRDPERIDRVERLLHDLGTNGADEPSELLPTGFDEIFGPVREARRKMKRP